jgi:multiple sugar transport system substrate-binding protein
MELGQPAQSLGQELLAAVISGGTVPDLIEMGGGSFMQYYRNGALQDQNEWVKAQSWYADIDPGALKSCTAPDGTRYEKGNENDMLDAIAAGDIILAPMFSPEGKTPGCGNDISGFGIPTGAKNVEAAHDFIHWIMSPEQNPAFVLGPGAGFPANTATLGDPQFQIPFYQAAAEALSGSGTPWHGTLENREVAAEMIMNVIYKLIKEDPTADSISELTLFQEEYNTTN